MEQPGIARTIYINFINSSNIKTYIQKVIQLYHLQIIKDLTTHVLHKSNTHRDYPVKCERITIAGTVNDFKKFDKTTQWEQIMENSDGILSRKCIAKD